MQFEAAIKRPFQDLKTFIIGIIISVIPIVNLLTLGRFGAAFSFGEAKRRGLTRPMFFAYVVAIIAGLVLSVLNVIPIVGTGASIFIIAVFSYTLYAEAYRSASGAPARAPKLSAKRKRK